VLVLAFVAALLFFAKLTIGTEQRISTGTTPGGAWTYASNLHLAEVRASYREYLSVPGFCAKKAALREPLRSQGVEP
jgi:hypothetical protein